MDRKLIWTEKASSDIEAIVRYIARRNPNAAARIGLGIYERTQIAKAIGASSFSDDGRSFTQSVEM